MSISNAALLVELNISVWTANKLDRIETRRINIDNAAASNAARVHKYLMAGTQLRGAISNYAAQVRAYHLLCTLPWSDKGPRLLSTAALAQYKAQMNEHLDTFNSMVEAYVDAYPNELEQARQKVTGLGELFDPTDYPDADTLRSKFGIGLVFSPLPSAGDFRLDIPQDDLEDMRRTYEESFDQRLKAAVQDTWDRLYAMLRGISTKLTDVEGEDKRYHDSLLTNANELCDLLKALNITNDQKLEDARGQLQSALRGIDIDGIRDSAAQRADVKARVDSIIKDYW